MPKRNAFASFVAALVGLGVLRLCLAPGAMGRPGSIQATSPRRSTFVVERPGLRLKLKFAPRRLCRRRLNTDPSRRSKTDPPPTAARASAGTQTLA